MEFQWVNSENKKKYKYWYLWISKETPKLRKSNFGVITIIIKVTFALDFECTLGVISCRDPDLIVVCTAMYLVCANLI